MMLYDNLATMRRGGGERAMDVNTTVDIQEVAIIVSMDPATARVARTFQYAFVHICPHEMHRPQCVNRN